jgi:hypothetical protein
MLTLLFRDVPVRRTDCSAIAPAAMAQSDRTPYCEHPTNLRLASRLLGHSGLREKPALSWQERQKRPDSGCPAAFYSIPHAAIRSVGPAPPALWAKVIPSRARMTCGKRMTAPAGPAPKSRSASFRNFDDRAIGRTERRGYDRRVDGSRNTKS